MTIFFVALALLVGILAGVALSVLFLPHMLARLDTVQLGRLAERVRSHR